MQWSLRMFQNVVGKLFPVLSVVIVAGCGTSVDLEIPVTKAKAYGQCLAPGSQGRCIVPSGGGAALGGASVSLKVSTIPPLHAKDVLTDAPFKEAFSGSTAAVASSDWLNNAACALEGTGIMQLSSCQPGKLKTGALALGAAVSGKTGASRAVAMTKSGAEQQLLRALETVYGDSPQFFLVASEIIEAHGGYRNNALALSAGSSGSTSVPGEAIAKQGFAVLKDDFVDDIDRLADKLSEAEETDVSAEIETSGIMDTLDQVRSISSQPGAWNITRAAVRMKQGASLTSAMSAGAGPAQLKRLADGFDQQARRIGFFEAYLRAYLREGNIVKFHLDAGDVKSAEEFIDYIDRKTLGLNFDALDEKYRAKLEKYLTKKYSKQKKKTEDFIQNWMKPGAVWSEFREETESKKRSLLKKLADAEAVSALTEADKEALFSELETLADRLLPAIKPWYDANVAKPLRIQCIEKNDVDTMQEILANCFPSLFLPPIMPASVKAALTNIETIYKDKRDAIKDLLVKLRDGISIRSGGGEDVAFVTRFGTKMQSPVASIHGSIKKSSLKLSNKNEVKAIPPDLVRVFIEAVFDSHQRLPAVSDATGTKDYLLSPLPAFADVEGTTGYEHISLEDFKYIANDSAMVESMTSLGTSVVVRGINVFSIDNDVIEAMVETLVSSLIRKTAEKAYWCAYACDIFKAPGDDAASGSATAAFGNLSASPTRKVTLDVNYGGLGF